MTTATQTNYTWEVLDRETIMEPMFREDFIILTNDNYPIGWVRDDSDAETIFNGRKIMNVQDGTTKFINPIIDAASETEILDPAIANTPAPIAPDKSAYYRKDKIEFSVMEVRPATM